MKYYLIVGEASGDLHASHLMRSLQLHDPAAEFRFFGGDNMAAVGGTQVRHFKDLAYMGFIPVLMHLRSISQGMAQCKRDIMEWQPDVVILVDYAGFNLSIAKYIREQRALKTSKPKIFYYIAPKIWAWKEYRIKNFKRDVDEMFSILPFEVDFFEKRHGYPIHYVGNPTADEVRLFRNSYKESHEDFCKRNNLDATKPIIAILAGSRKQEIKDNLPMMLRVMRQFPGYQAVIAGAPAISDDYYSEVISAAEGSNGSTSQPFGQWKAVHNDTYALLSHSTAALVTSGTATLETAIFDVPQVVCYKTPVPRLARWAFNNIIRCKYISLVNLIADSEIVQELFADRFTEANIINELRNILPGAPGRQTMLNNYDEIDRRLGNDIAPDNAARTMIEMMRK